MPPSEPVPPMAAAMQWVSRIFAAAMMMVLPGVAGQWLDGKLGTKFVALLGFAFGLVAGMTYLIAQARRAEESRRVKRDADEAIKDPQDESKP